MSDPYSWFLYSLLIYMAMYFLIILAILVQFVKSFISIKVEIKRFFFSFALSIVSCFSIFLIPRFITWGYHAHTNGLVERMTKEADIESIQSWLDGLGTNIIIGSNLSDKSKWAPAIRRLEPNHVFIGVLGDQKRYVRLVWGSAMTGRCGLIVGANEKEIPLNDFYASEYRVKLNQNSFVWYGLDRPAEEVGEN
jgi:hypothetical protein